MLPEAFKERMKKLLAEDYSLFERQLTEEGEVKGVRLNRQKCDPELVGEEFLERLEPLPYLSDGYILKNPEGIGNTPEHHSGMIYVQDPGAMAALAALEIERGWYALDTCAAPGGKASALAAAIGEEGFLLANEYVPKRAKILVGNFERLGITNAIVTSLDTKELGGMARGVFDLVLCDAPCSGEGMFRKSCPAIEEWSEENVELCAKRQREILSNISGLVKSGGYLLYSTCTYSLEENEMTVDEFLSRHPEYSLAPVREELAAATADGVQFEGAKCAELKLCRRFYPHVSRGEGQFIALMKKDENSSDMPTVLYKSSEKAPSREEMAIVKAFFKENLTEEPMGRLVKLADRLAILPEGLPLPERMVFMAGVTLGEIRKGVLHPHHQFFSAYGSLFKRREILESGDARLSAYLAGEEIDAKSAGSGGWVCVCYGGVPIGGGKASGGRIKNHYPKGLRV